MSYPGPLGPLVLSADVFANSLVSYQAQQNDRPDLDPNCWFVCFDSLCPINNLSVIKGQVLLGWTSTKLGLTFLLKETTQWPRWGSNMRPFGIESSILPLSHCTPTKLLIFLKDFCGKNKFKRKSEDHKISCKIAQFADLKGIDVCWKTIEYELSYDVASGSEIMSCNKINKPLVVYRFSGNVMTSTTK